MDDILYRYRGWIIAIIALACWFGGALSWNCIDGMK